jgi:3-methyl-2-oxobutanoate hydroxymethyltransferase
MMATKRKKVTIQHLQEMKVRRERIVALGVYDAPMAAMADDVGFELFVIGNSGPMCLFGHERSTAVRPDELLFMTQAVSRVTTSALIAATMPYPSYLVSKADGVRAAAWLVSEGGAECVQCHGDRHSAKRIRSIVRAGIPVLAHIGLQSVRKTAQSGFKVQGRDAVRAQELVDDIHALADAGVFAFIVELIPSELTAFLAEQVPVPIISLGSGPRADGIYLVSGDLVGHSAFRRPSNAGQFADVRGLMRQGLQDFFDCVRSGQPLSGVTPNRMVPGEFEKLKVDLV